VACIWEGLQRYHSMPSKASCRRGKVWSCSRQSAREKNSNVCLTWNKSIFASHEEGMSHTRFLNVESHPVAPECLPPRYKAELTAMSEWDALSITGFHSSLEDVCAQ